MMVQRGAPRRDLRQSITFVAISLVAFWASLCASFDEERILSFDSTIKVAADATMQVREDITVLSLGRAIVHGIVREFPTRYHDRLGNRYVVDFVLNNVLYDGRVAPYHIESIANGEQIYIGDQNTVVPPGEHIYTIEYTTGRQLGFFKDYDELYWNVTGNGWRLPIDHVTAKVTLPRGISPISAEAYTGPQGARGTDYTAQLVSSGAIFASMRHFSPFEGLTIVVTWPKGFVTPPSLMTRVWYFFKDNLGFLWLFLGLLSTLLWYVLAWLRFRRTQRRGTIIPLFEPPDDFTAAEVRYLFNKGFDNKAFAVSIVELAVRGALRIEYIPGSFLSRGSYVVHNVSDYKGTVNSRDEAMLKVLFQEGDSIALTNEHAVEIQAARGSLEGALKGTVGRHVENNVFAIGAGVGMTLFWLMTLLLGAAWWPGAVSSFLIMSAVMFFIVMNWIFISRLHGYTPHGCALRDKIEGFKLFLETTEIERLKVIGTPPTRTPELWERYLPYAMALGVEEQWSRQFSPIFDKLEREGHPYAPVWMYGMPIGHFNATRFSSEMSSALSSAISSSTTLPGSTSGRGGSGSSGGGGGGGGGGGW